MSASKAEQSDSTPQQSTQKSFAAYPTRKESSDHVTHVLWDHRDRVILVVLTLLTLFTRLYQIGKHPKIYWDEVYMAKFGAQYINGTFYHDVHSVAGKLLIGLSEYVSGHNGSFTYKSGAKYPPHINYVFQRSSMAVIG
ncbi:Protein O-mannosyltransferase 2, partial [Coemansia sp. RSA 720]